MNPTQQARFLKFLPEKEALDSFTYIWARKGVEMDRNEAEEGRLDIETRILTVRGHRVILDADLAGLYGVRTQRLNEAVRRNRDRFPEDFVFLVEREEVAVLISQNAISKPGRGGRTKPPWAYTEHGAVMASMVLNSPQAVRMGVFVVRAFVKMREQLGSSTALAKRLARIERTLIHHDASLRDLYRKIKPLLLPPERPRKKIGFDGGD